MVKKLPIVFLLTLLCLSVVQTAMAQSFTASADKTQVTIGESFTLQLSLKDAAPDGYPDLNIIEKDFTLYGQNQSTRTNIANGRVSSSIDWYLTLLPKEEGEVTIPSFTVTTDAGELSTKEITLSVTKHPVATNGQPYKERAIKVETSVNNDMPYQGEPVIFTAQLIAVKGITDVALSPLEIEGAIIEPYEKPSVKEGVVQGRHTTIVEAKYLITPLVSGKLRIPSFSFKGQIESERHNNTKQPFMGLGLFGAFEAYEPFIIGGNAIELNIKPPATAMDPWLPLQSFKILDEWEDIERAEIGQPITLRITMRGVGSSGSSLPNLEKYISTSKAFKTYADKPEVTQEIDSDDQTLKGVRQESYTLIPVRAGDITIPEIKIPWWNIITDKVEYSTIPARTITVDQGEMISPPAPQQQDTAQNAPVSQNEGVKSVTDVSSKEELAPSNQAALYGVIIALGGFSVILLIANIMLLIRLKKQHAPLVDGSSKPAARKKINLSAISKVSSAEELKAFVQSYAHIHFGMRENVPLRSITRELKMQNLVFIMIEDMLYRAENYDLKELKMQAKEALEDLSSQAHNKEGERHHSPLNPS